MLIRFQQRFSVSGHRSIDERELLNASMTVGASDHRGSENFVLAEQSAGVFVVAAGIDGAAGASEASEFVSGVIANELMEADVDCSFDMAQARRAVENAARVALDGMQELAVACPELASMGSSLAFGWFVRGVFYFGHIGNCQIYVIRDRIASRITSDHSNHSPTNHDGTAAPPARYLGPSSPNVRLTMGAIEMRRDDRVALFTESLSSLLPEESICAAARYAKDPNEMCHWLKVASENISPHVVASCLVVDYRNRIKSFMQVAN